MLCSILTLGLFSIILTTSLQNVTLLKLDLILCLKGISEFKSPKKVCVRCGRKKKKKSILKSSVYKEYKTFCGSQ